MFDRGLAATQSAKDINGNKLFAQEVHLHGRPGQTRRPLVGRLRAHARRRQESWDCRS